jgi:hypothetical protein
MIPRASISRRALGLTAEDLAPRYRLALDSLRDREQGRFEPDQPAAPILLF